MSFTQDEGVIATLEAQDSRAVWGEVLSENQLLQFSEVGSISDTGTCPGVARSVAPSYLAGMDSSGVLYQTAWNPESPYSWTIGSANSSRKRLTTQYLTSLHGDWDGYRYYSAWFTWGGNPQVYVTSGVGGPSTAYGPQIPVTMVNSASKVVRVDSVCHTPLGIVVAIGYYNFGAVLATQRYWLVTSNSAQALNTFVQSALTDTYSTWYGVNPEWSSVYALDDGRSIEVIAYDGHRPWQFRVTNGIESQLEMVYPIDDTLYSDDSLPEPTCRPNGIWKMNGLYYLCNTVTRPFTDGTQVEFEMYQTSEDLKNWSIGEYSSFVCASAINGSLCNDGTYAYWLGSGVLYKAPLRVIDGVGIPTDVSGKIIDVTIDRAESSSDSASVDAFNYQLVNNLSVGNLLTISAGYYSGDSRYGVTLGRFAVDEQPDPITPAGRNTSSVSAIDVGSWKLKQWAAQTDIDRWSRTVIQSTLGDMSEILVQTAQRDVQFGTATAFSSVALNDPFVATTSTQDGRDGLSKMTMRFTNEDSCSLTSAAMLFGADTNGNENAVLIPLANKWSGHIQALPKVMTVNAGNLSRDPHATAMWETINADTIASLFHVPNATAGSEEYYYYPSSATATSPNVDYQYTTRVSGRRVQLYRKIVDHTLNMADNAWTMPVMEYRFNETARQKFATDTYWGYGCGTDVPASAEWFRQAYYGDMELQLTDAADSANTYSSYTVMLNGDVSHNDAYGSDYQFLVGTDGTMSRIAGSTFSDETPISFFHAGMKLFIPPWGVKTVQSVNSSGKTVKFSDLSLSHSGYYNVYALGPTDTWGTADSGYSKTTTDDGYTIYTDTGASYTDVVVAGTGYFVTDDQTAGSIRRVETNGVDHTLKSGNETSGAGWDETSPVKYGADSWRLILHHGRFFVGKPSDFGLPSRGYFIVDDEVIRYYTSVAYKRGDYGAHLAANAIYWCEVPTFYSTINGAAASATSFTNWGSNPGNGFGDIEGALGGTLGTTNYAKDMLVELSARSSSTDITPDDSSTSYHVDHVASRTLYLDQEYPYAVDQPYPNTQSGHEDSTDGAVAIVSGRGQLGTSKLTHDSDAIVCYYPTAYPSTDPLKYLIRIFKYDVYAGLFNSAQDDLNYLCSLAGTRGVGFRTRGYYTGALSSTVTMADQNGDNLSLSDFVLDINTHLYASTSEAPLRIAFRNGYLLDIDMLIDAALCASGRVGTIRLSLQNTASGINGTTKYLDRVPVMVADADISGTYSKGTHIEDTSRKCNIRLIVHDNQVAIEADGCNVWTFNLDDYDYTDSSGTTVSNKLTSPGPISIACGEAPTVTATISELCDEIENHVIDMGQTGTDALSWITEDRHIFSRTTPEGGLYFARWFTRDSKGTIDSQIYADEKDYTQTEPIGHICASGAEFGEYIDEAWMQQYGYRFGLSQNRLLSTVQDSKDEAKLLVTLSKQYARQSKTTRGTRLLIHPGDSFTCTYGTPGGDTVYQPPQDYIATSQHIEISENALAEECDAREA
jgi:hypothetical protein